VHCCLEEEVLLLSLVSNDTSTAFAANYALGKMPANLPNVTDTPQKFFKLLNDCEPDHLNVSEEGELVIIVGPLISNSEISPSFVKIYLKGRVVSNQ
jgi:hypothetical protein